MIRLFIDNKEIDTGRIVFSDGAFGFDLKNLPETAHRIVFSVDPSTKVNTILDELYQLNDALNRSELYYCVDTSLYLPYLPYARADRKFSENGNYGLHQFITRLSEFNFDKIIVVDPHNPVKLNTQAKMCFSPFSRVEIISQLEALGVALNNFRVDIKQYDAIIAPDKGAVGKAQVIADYYGLPLITCTKERDPATGKLSNPMVNGDVSGKKLLIVDDLLDAGMTYIQLATELQKQVPTQIDLYVTHLIASKGLDILHGKIDNLFCYHTVAGYVTKDEVYKFNKGE